MHKTISLFIILALAVSVFGPGLGIAEEFDTKMTESDPILTEEGDGESTSTTTTASPVIKAVWSMNGSAVELLGTDDGPESQAQFLPSGQYQVPKPISVCAVVSDASSIEDIDAVFSEVYYPALSFQESLQDDRLGCGEQKGEKCRMTQLTKQDGLGLFCDAIQNNNANLPLFYDIYGFSGICGEEGELASETAAVFCCDQELLYDDLAGQYNVLIFGQDKAGLSSNILAGNFAYLELTAFEADFTVLDYGPVVLNSRKVIEGDLIWDEPKGENPVTVRNVGNTRLQMEIEQDDMGLEKTDGIWNIRYGARVGEGSLWQNYWPQEITLLDKILELSGMDRMDFSIEVLNFPENENKDYSGKMTLNARKTEFLACEIIQ